MEKMFVYPEVLESVILDGSSSNEAERARSKAGVVSYRCKVYRARLQQGTAGRAASGKSRFPAPKLVHG